LLRIRAYLLSGVGGGHGQVEARGDRKRQQLPAMGGRVSERGDSQQKTEIRVIDDAHDTPVLKGQAQAAATWKGLIEGTLPPAIWDIAAASTSRTSAVQFSPPPGRARPDPATEAPPGKPPQSQTYLRDRIHRIRRSNGPRSRDACL
jgi:hypothetical protein